MSETPTIEPDLEAVDLTADETAAMNAAHLVRTAFARAYGIDAQPDPVRSMLQITHEWCILVMSHGGPAAFARECLEGAKGQHGTHGPVGTPARPPPRRRLYVDGTGVCNWTS